jgi:hypothetical protein
MVSRDRDRPWTPSSQVNNSPPYLSRATALELYPIVGYSETGCIRNDGVPFLKQADYIRRYRAFLVKLRQAREEVGLRQTERGESPTETAILRLKV